MADHCRICTLPAEACVCDEEWPGLEADESAISPEEFLERMAQTPPEPPERPAVDFQLIERILRLAVVVLGVSVDASAIQRAAAAIYASLAGGSRS